MGHIRRADVNDALVISEISVETWKDAYKGLLPQELLDARSVDEKRIDSWRENISNTDYTVLVYESGKVCGYQWAGKKRDEIDIPYEIYAIYVRSECQNPVSGGNL